MFYLNDSFIHIAISYLCEKKLSNPVSKEYTEVL